MPIINYKKRIVFTRNDCCQNDGCLGWIIIIGIYLLVAPICHLIMIFCPPVAILIQGQLAADEFGIFDCFGVPYELPRADTSTDGHVKTTKEKLTVIPGAIRGFLFCLLLTCCGWLPGVIYAFFSVYLHLFLALASANLFCCFQRVHP